MNRRLHLSRFAPLGLVAALTGCDYSPPVEDSMAPTGVYDAGPAGQINPPAGSNRFLSEEDLERKKDILDGALKLIQSSATSSGGNPFQQATKNLNQYFEGTARTDFKLDPAARSYLLRQMPEPVVAGLEVPKFTDRDARHLEDCMLYSSIATRVAGTGDDLTRVGRVFDWMVRQVQLIPPESLYSPSLQQAVYSRPFDVLLRGMATEAEGSWAERSWLFMALCRQLGIDVGLVTYTPRGQKEPIVWVCAALIDGKAYLFDARIGMAVPGPDGTGVATLDEALRDPVVLDRLDLPGQSPYATSRVVLLNSPSKLGILIDSSTGYLTGRMRLLQQSLAGGNRTILHRDPADQADKFAEALGARFGGATLWEFPAMVETLLFTDSRFVQASLQALVLFDPKFPLLQARMKQLRGEVAEALPELVSMRLTKTGTLADKKTPIPKEAQQALDIYGTYYLGLCNLEMNNTELAAGFFRDTLAMLPEPGPGLPYYHMYRWGAQANLARLYEAKGDVTLAAQYYSQLDPTSQHHGNLLRARGLIWREPAAPLPPPLPPAPPSIPRATATASTTGG